MNLLVINIYSFLRKWCIFGYLVESCEVLLYMLELLIVWLRIQEKRNGFKIKLQSLC